MTPYTAGRVIVSGFDAIIGQRTPIRLLQTLLDKEAIPHALLFTGPEGVGKRMTARALAMALNCRADQVRKSACGQCRSCRQIVSGTHPDIILIQPQGAYLRIDQIRGLISTLGMKPLAAAHRVVIIAETQRMNAEAGNALLKVLEEPPRGTVLILTAPHPSDLLPTLVSRCRHIRFHPLDVEEVAALLTEKDALPVEQARAAARMAGGSYTKARYFAGSNWRDRRDWLVRAAGFDTAEGLRGRSLRPSLAFAAELAARKDEIVDLIDVLMTWVRDLCILPHAPEQIANTDCIDLLGKVRSGISRQRLLKVWDALAKTQKDIAANANLRLTLDAMALKIAETATRDHALSQ